MCFSPDPSSLFPNCRNHSIALGNVNVDTAVHWLGLCLNVKNHILFGQRQQKMKQKNPFPPTVKTKLFVRLIKKKTLKYLVSLAKIRQQACETVMSAWVWSRDLNSLWFIWVTSSLWSWQEDGGSCSGTLLWICFKDFHETATLGFYFQNACFELFLEMVTKLHPPQVRTFLQATVLIPPTQQKGNILNKQQLLAVWDIK